VLTFVIDLSGFWHVAHNFPDVIQKIVLGMGKQIPLTFLHVDSSLIKLLFDSMEDMF
jgi:hypothetical protein